VALTSPALAATLAGHRRLGGFLLVGAVTSLAYVVLYAALQPVAGEQLANAVALLVTADANTVGNRRLSFGLTGRDGAVRHHAQGFVAFGVGLVLTSAALAALDAGGLTGGWVHVAVLLGANVAAGCLHFALLRSWVFAPGATPRPGRSPRAPIVPSARRPQRSMGTSIRLPYSAQPPS
jgi:putative flippase GtrA